MGMKRTLTLMAVVLLLGYPLAGGAAERKDAPGERMRQVVVEVNGEQITLGEIEERLRLLAPAVRIRIRENKEQFLEGLVQAELLYQEAVRLGVDKSPRIQKRVERLKRRLVIEQFLKRDVETANVSEEQLRDFFAVNKDRFRRKESVTLAHIVLETEKEAWDAVAELRRGIPFGQVARRRSIFESTRDAGGAMGTADRGTLEKALEDVAFQLPIGQPSEPIKTSAGWQIIRVTERVGAADAKYEDVQDDVRLLHAEIRRRESYEALLGSLRKKAKIKVFPEKFR